jgi:hypothetical protein
MGFYFTSLYRDVKEGMSLIQFLFLLLFEHILDTQSLQVLMVVDKIVSHFTSYNSGEWLSVPQWNTHFSNA